MIEIHRPWIPQAEFVHAGIGWVAAHEYRVRHSGGHEWRPCEPDPLFRPDQ